VSQGEFGFEFEGLVVAYGSYFGCLA
jgi:hypothetical protein